MPFFDPPVAAQIPLVRNEKVKVTSKLYYDPWVYMRAKTSRRFRLLFPSSIRLLRGASAATFASTAQTFALGGPGWSVPPCDARKRAQSAWMIHAVANPALIRSYPGGAHNSALYLPCTRKNPPAKTPLLSGKPTRAHLVRTIVYYEWAHHKNPAACCECFEWAQR